MAALLVLAIATHGKVGVMGKRCQQVKNTGGFGLAHLGSKFPLENTP
jgi:hypothetical protein